MHVLLSFGLYWKILLRFIFNLIYTNVFFNPSLNPPSAGSRQALPRGNSIPCREAAGVLKRLPDTKMNFIIPLVVLLPIDFPGKVDEQNYEIHFSIGQAF